MALLSVTSGRVLCSLHHARIPPAICCSALITPSFNNAKRRAVTVRATQDGYAVADSGHNSKSDSLSKITMNNDGKPSAAADLKGFSYAAALRLPESPLVTSSGNPSERFIEQAESAIERAIFDFRFLALLAIAGSLAGSLLCFLNGCVYIVESFRVFWTSCLKGIHTGQVVLRLVEAVDVYLAGTVMLIFGMGLYGLFISNVPGNMPPDQDRALQNSSLFGMFTLKERPRWMCIKTLAELKTKVGHVIVMILLVKMFERSKTIIIASGNDLLSFSFFQLKFQLHLEIFMTDFTRFIFEDQPLYWFLLQLDSSYWSSTPLSAHLQPSYGSLYGSSYSSTWYFEDYLMKTTSMFKLIKSFKAPLPDLMVMTATFFSMMKEVLNMTRSWSPHQGGMCVMMPPFLVPCLLLSCLH